MNRLRNSKVIMNVLAATKVDRATFITVQPPAFF